MTDMSMDKPTGVRIEARFVPFPRSVSAEARAALAKHVKPDGTLRHRVPNPAPDDKAGWAAARAQTEKAIMQRMVDRLALVTASVETVKIAGVTVHVGTPATLSADAGKRSYINIHGGALVYGNGMPCRAGAQIAAQRHGVTVYAIAISQTTLPFLTSDYDQLYEQIHEFVLTLSADRIGMQYQKLFQWLAKTFKRALWVERSGGSLRIVEQLITHFPNTRFVHLVRDGRDCAISMSHHYGFRMVVIAFALTGMLSIDPFEDSDRSQIDDVTDEYYPFLPEHFDAEAFRQFNKPSSFYARYWSSELRNNITHLQQLPAGRVLTMRYEDFLLHPEESCRKLITFIDPQLLDEHWVIQARGQIRFPTLSRSNLSDRELELLTQACHLGNQALIDAYPEL